MAIVLDRRERKCPFLFSESSTDQYYSRMMAIFHTLFWMVAEFLKMKKLTEQNTLDLCTLYIVYKSINRQINVFKMTGENMHNIYNKGFVSKI